MRYEKLPIEIQTLYGELLERLVALEARRAIGHVQGSFVAKRIKGKEYYYFQYLEPGGKKRQLYVGRADDILRRVVSRYRESREEIASERESIQRLCTLLRAGGALSTDTASARVLRALADAGVFHLGGVLVGTQAFIVIGNLLGVRWEGTGLRTQDIDITAERSVRVAIGDLPETTVPSALESLEMGFVPVPGLDPDRASTSFKVRGQGLRVDLLTPARRPDESRPVRIPRFQMAAQPLRFLDFAMEDPIRAAVIDGDGVLVNVPRPAVFALHKLLTASERPVATHVKRDKDVLQAGQVLSFLLEERPGDVRLAWEALAARGANWVKLARRGLELLAVHDEGLAARIREVIA